MNEKQKNAYTGNLRIGNSNVCKPRTNPLNLANSLDVEVLTVSLAWTVPARLTLGMSVLIADPRMSHWLVKIREELDRYHVL